MEVRADAGKFREVEADAMVVLIFEGEDPSEGVLGEVNDAVGGLVGELLGSDELRGKSGDTVYIYRPSGLAAKRLLLVGAGKRDEFDVDTLRQVAGSAARFLRSKGVKSMAMLRRSQIDIVRAAEAVVEGVLLALYDSDVYRTQDREERRIETLVLCTAGGEGISELERGITRGRVLAEATNFTRELVNEPSNSMTPSIVAERATEMAGRFGLEIDVLD